MILILAKRIIPNFTEYEDAAVRQKYGVLCGAVGILLNLLLFAGKFIAGLLSGSIAVAADAFNNLSDAGSSLITLAGFRLAGQKPDTQHPFGHGRFEYLSGLFVSILILLMGFELGKSALDKILHPEPVAFRWISVAILGASIGIKLYMSLYNRSYGRKINSPAMLATAADSLGDAVSTSAVLGCMILSETTGLNLDGYCGIAVALMIFIAGFRSAKETVSPLLGQPPEPEFVNRIEEIVLSYEGVSGIHDLIVHDYGPGRRIISLHAEVPADADIWIAHDTIDNIENRIGEDLGCIAVIHMDPVITDNEQTVSLYRAIREEVKDIHPSLTIHDFRMVPGPTHTNVIFDTVLPYECRITEEEAQKSIALLISERHENVRAVVKIDRRYT